MTDTTSMDSSGPASRSVVDPRTGWCFTHDPSRVEERQLARVKGGRHSSVTFRLNAAMSPDVADVVRVLGETITGVRQGEVPPAVGNSVASLARAMIAALESERVEVRLRSLEDVLERLEHRGVALSDGGGHL